MYKRQLEYFLDDDKGGLSLQPVNRQALGKLIQEYQYGYAYDCCYIMIRSAFLSQHILPLLDIFADGYHITAFLGLRQDAVISYPSHLPDR